VQNVKQDAIMGAGSSLIDSVHGGGSGSWACHCVESSDDSEKFFRADSFVDGAVHVDSRLDRRLHSGIHGVRFGESSPYHPLKSQDTCDPDVVNALFTRLWPYFSDFVTGSLTTALEPAAKKAMGKFGAVFSIDHDDQHLGDAPIKCSQLRIHETIQTADPDDLRNVTLQASIVWDGVTNLHVKLKDKRVGITSITLSGVLTLEFVGLIASPPFFQGIRFYFVDKPVLKLEFGGFATSVLNLDLVRRTLAQSITDQIAQILVAPHVQGISLMETVDVMTILHPIPRGVLRVTVKSANGLRTADINGFSDPYVTVSCGAESSRSVTKTKTLAPVWSHEVNFAILSTNSQCVDFVFKDQDTLTGDDLLGKLRLGVLELISWGEGEKHLSLEDESGATGQNGKACIVAEWRPLLQPDVVTKKVFSSGAEVLAKRRGLIFVGVESASHLAWHSDETIYWVVTDVSEVEPSWPSCGLQSTHRLAITESIRRTAVAEQALLKDKIDLCKKYKMKVADIASLLEVDATSMNDIDHLGECHGHEVLWDEGCDFLVKDIEKARITFQLWAYNPSAKAVTWASRLFGQGKAKGEVLLGKKDYMISNLASGTSPSYCSALQLTECRALLKVRVELRLLGDPTDDPQRSCVDLSSREQAKNSKRRSSRIYSPAGSCYSFFDA
jgi:hypothetical protein